VKAIPDARNIPLLYFVFEAHSKSLGVRAWIVILLPLIISQQGEHV